MRLGMRRKRWASSFGDPVNPEVVAPEAYQIGIGRFIGSFASNTQRHCRTHPKAARREERSGQNVAFWPLRFPVYCICLMAGGFHDPSMIDGGVSFGQYSRIIGMNFAFGAGSQLASLSLPGDSACR